MKCEFCKCKVPKDCTICMECFEREFQMVEGELIEREPEIVSWSKPVKAACRKRNSPKPT
jgi:hypothetical protein